MKAFGLGFRRCAQHRFDGAARVSIAVIMALGYFYYSLSGGGAALASIGLIAFAGISQILPASGRWSVLAGGDADGRTWLGCTVGFVLWIYTLLLPGMGGAWMPQSVLDNGPFGIRLAASSQAMFGIEGMDPMVHTVMWSMSLNTIAFCVASLLSFPSPLERLQGAQFVNVFRSFRRPARVDRIGGAKRRPDDHDPTDIWARAPRRSSFWPKQNNKGPVRTCPNRRQGFLEPA